MYKYDFDYKYVFDYKYDFDYECDFHYGYNNFDYKFDFVAVLLLTTRIAGDPVVNVTLRVQKILVVKSKGLLYCTLGLTL